MNEAITDIRKKIEELAESKGSSYTKAVRDWKKNAQSRLIMLAHTLNSSSPFNYTIGKRDIRFSKQKAGKSYSFGDLMAYSTRPNAAMVEGFNAPVSKFMQVNDVYKFTTGGKWLSTHKMQEKTTSAGIETVTPDVLTDDVKLFGLKSGRVTEAYAAGYSMYGYKAIPAWSDVTYLDWMLIKHPDQVEQIIIDCGNEAIDYIISL